MVRTEASMKRFLSSLLPALCAILLISPAALRAQTTGTISGRVTDETGGTLPGATVEASSPALQGTRVATTDGSGTYRLTFLPPGSYAVTFTLQGFATDSHKEIRVDLDKDTTLDSQLRAAMTETITVTSDAPVVDTTTTTLGTKLDQRAIETLPTARNYAAVVQISPGVSTDANQDNDQQSTVTVYGSSGSENIYYIDGVNTTGAEYGFQGKELNFEFIQAVDVKTGGYEAEYGKATGGIINVITKSGGNQFHGDLFGYRDDDSQQASAEEVFSAAGTPRGFRRQDYGVGLGGYLVRDKLWFFGAYDKVSNSADTGLPAGPMIGQTVTGDSKRDLAALKLTYRLSDSHSLIGNFFQDPRDDTGAINDASHTLIGDPLTYTGVKKFGGKDYAVRYEGILSSSWLATAQAARHQEENSIAAASAAGDAIEFRDAGNDFFQTGGFGLLQTKSFQRDFAGGSLTHYLPQHELKGGLEYETEKADVERRYSGGQQIDVFQNAVHPGLPIYSHFYWTTPDATLANAPVSKLTASPKHDDTSAYLQDRWSPLPNLTFTFGVRWDRQQIIDAQGTKQIDLKKDFAPRFGFICDPSEDHRSKFYGSFGRFYEQIPMDLVIRSFSFERQARIFNYSPTSITPDPGAESDLDRGSAIFGGFTEPADPNLRNQYLNEALLGYEREVLPDLSVGIKAIYRDYGEVIEDFLCMDDGTYCIGNPGKGLMRQVFTLDYSQQFPAPAPKRIFKGIELSANKRFSKNWQALASYLYSKLEGNFDGLFAPFTNVGPDPNISAAYDYYDFFTNGSNLSNITNRGSLSNDRRHQLKLSGLYQTPWKLNLGLSAFYRSGTPLTRYGYSDAYGRWEFFLTRRGAEGRTPSNYDADLHLGYPLTLGPATVNFLFDVFDLLDTQRAVLLDERWGFQEADNASPTPVNPNYGKPVLRTPPRSYRLGLRVSF
jgi:hypothetical protein